MIFLLTTVSYEIYLYISIDTYTCPKSGTSCSGVVVCWCGYRFLYRLDCYFSCLNSFSLVIFWSLYSLLFGVCKGSVLKVVLWSIMVFFTSCDLDEELSNWLALIPHLLIYLYTSMTLHQKSTLKTVSSFYNDFIYTKNDHVILYLYIYLHLCHLISILTSLSSDWYIYLHLISIHICVIWYHLYVHLCHLISILTSVSAILVCTFFAKSLWFSLSTLVSTSNKNLPPSLLNSVKQG